MQSLLKHREMAGKLGLMRELGLSPRGFATLTLHRPSNVDDPKILRGLVETLSKISEELPIVFPMHPRTRKVVEQTGLASYFNSGGKPRGLWITDPLGYLEFLHLNMNARMVITDSGGLQEESTVLGVPCLTLRENTERPITVEVGTNRIVGTRPEAILAAAREVLDTDTPRGRAPDKWDGKASERIVDILLQQFGA